MNFGHVNVNTKIKDLQKEKSDILIIDNINPESPTFFMFLLDVAEKDKRVIQNLKNDLKVIGIDSYIALSCVDYDKLEETSTPDLLAKESQWRKYLNYQQKECSAIISFGWAIRILNKSADISYFDFTDELFAPIRYFCGSKFVGGPDKWIYPVNSINAIYPYKELNSTDVVNMHTRIFRKHMAMMKDDDFSTKSLDMREPVVIEVEPNKIDEVLDSLMDSELLALDTETGGFNCWEDQLGTVQLCNDGQIGYFFSWSDLRVYKRKFTKVLKSAKRLTLANGKFDIRFLFVNGIKGVYPTDDTCLLSHAMCSYRPKGLKPGTWFWCGSLGGYDDALDKIKKKMKVTSYLQIVFPILKEYAGMDPISTWRQQVAMDAWCHHIDEIIPNEKIPEWTIYKWYKEVMIPNLCACIDNEINGVFFDKAYMDFADKEIQQKIEECKKELAKTWGVTPQFPFTSTVELGKLFEKLGWPCVGERAKTGVYPTSDAALTEYKRIGKPGIDTLKRFRSLNVARNAFVIGWGDFVVHHSEDNTDRVHPSCNTFGTTSMRHAMNDPNFQQIPSHGEISDYMKRFFCSPYTRQLIEVEDDQGNTWDNKEFTAVITNRGSVNFEDLQDDDVIIEYDQSKSIYQTTPSLWYV